MPGNQTGQAGDPIRNKMTFHNQPDTPEMLAQKVGASAVGGNVGVESGSTFVGGNQGLNGEEVKGLLEVVLKFIDKSYLNHPGELDQVLTDFKERQAEIKEWKELHNYLDSTIQIYDQFLREVQRSTIKDPNIPAICSSWFQIDLMLDNLLNWAKTIECIGIKYTDDGDKLLGEPWATRLEQTRREIQGHLDGGRIRLNSPGSQPILDKLMGIQIDEKWCNQLKELASRYHTLTLTYMHNADDNLRRTVADLLEISQKFLVR